MTIMQYVQLHVWLSGLEVAPLFQESLSGERIEAGLRRFTVASQYISDCFK